MISRNSLFGRPSASRKSRAAATLVVGLALPALASAPAVAAAQPPSAAASTLSISQQLQQLLPQLPGLPAGSPIPQQVAGPLADTIDQVAATNGVPASARGALTQLSQWLRSGNPPTPAQAAALIRQLAQAPGVPAPAGTALEEIAGSLGAGGSNGSNGSSGSNGSPGAGGVPGFAGPNPFGPGFNPYGANASGRNDPAAARPYGAVIANVRYDARRRSVLVVVFCRATHTSCNTAVAVYKGRKLVVHPAGKTISPRKRATYLLRVSNAVSRAVAKQRITLRAVAVSNTPYGRTHSARTVHVKSTSHGAKHHH